MSMSPNYVSKLIGFIVCVVVLLGSFVLFTNEDGIFVTGLILNTFSFVIAAISLWCLLQLIDSTSNVNFQNRVEKISEDPLSSAIYYATRLLALAILAAFIYS